MWTNSELKSRAKGHLRHFYWFGFAVCFIITVVMILAEGKEIFEYIEKALHLLGVELHVSLPAFLTSTAFSILALCIKFFALFPMEVGERRFFMEHRDFNASFKDAFFAFWHIRRYFNIVLTMLANTLIVTAGLILLIVPGVIFFFRLSMMSFIIAENPDLPVWRVISLSWNMTKGFTSKIFTFYISWIGWVILATLTIGIAWLFISPYFAASFDELFQELRSHALESGIATGSELPDMVPAD